MSSQKQKRAKLAKKAFYLIKLISIILDIAFTLFLFAKEINSVSSESELSVKEVQVQSIEETNSVQH